MEPHMNKHKEMHQKRIELESALLCKMEFGKYRKQDLYYIYQNDPGYLKWLVSKGVAWGQLKLSISVVFSQEEQLKRWIKRGKKFI